MGTPIDPLAPGAQAGAGAKEPALVRWDEIALAAEVAFRRILAGRSERNRVFLGRHKVDRVILLDRVGELAEQLGCQVVRLETSGWQSLAQRLAIPLMKALGRLTLAENSYSTTACIHALALGRGFADTFGSHTGEFDSASAEVPPLCSGDLETDLTNLLVAVGQAAQLNEAAVVLLIDDIQILRAGDLPALLGALHRIAQCNLPVVLFGTGVPLVTKLVGDAKPYGERLFIFHDTWTLTSTSL